MEKQGRVLERELYRAAYAYGITTSQARKLFETVGYKAMVRGTRAVLQSQTGMSVSEIRSNSQLIDAKKKDIRLYREKHSNSVELGVKMKYCPHCSTWKEVSEFYNGSKNKDEKHCYCKVCTWEIGMTTLRISGKSIRV